MKTQNKRMLSLGLSLLNAVGVVATFVLTINDTKKYLKEKEKLKENATKKQKAYVFLKNYKTSLIVGSTTLISGIFSKIISYKTEASLIATATMLDTSLRKYKSKIKETLGIDADKKIQASIMKDAYKAPTEEPEANELLFWEEHIGYFYAKIENIHKAMIMINEDMSGNGCWYSTGRECTGYITIGEFLKLCEGRPLSHNLTPEKLNFGWSFDYLGDYCEYYWVHLDIAEPDENGARMLYWFETPVWNPDRWYDYVHGEITKEEYTDGYLGNPDKFKEHVYMTKKD